MIIYGSNMCPDTLYALHKCVEQKVDFSYKDITGCLAYLKEFIELREKDEQGIYAAVKARGGMGIPCFILADGTITLELEDALK